MGWGPRMHVARDSRAGSYLIWAEFRGSPDGCSPCQWIPEMVLGFRV